MNLKAYLEQHGIKKVAFAKRLGINPASLHQILNGKHCPSLKNAKRIEEITEGEVTINELLGEKSATVSLRENDYEQILKDHEKRLQLLEKQIQQCKKEE